MVKVAFSEQYIYELPEGHRFPIAKYKRIVDKLLEDKIIGPHQIFDPGMVGKEVLLAHDIEYYNKVVQLALNANEIRALGVPLHEASVNRALNSVAGTLRSAEIAAKQDKSFGIEGKGIKNADREVKINPTLNIDREPKANPGMKVNPKLKADLELNLGPKLKLARQSKTDQELEADTELNLDKQSKADPELKYDPELNLDQESKKDPESKADPELNSKHGIYTRREVKKISPKAFNQDLEGSNARLGITIGGGYHHAFYDHGEGFCIFNDLAITARNLIDKRLAKRILIIDLDVHQGNGTASILNKDDNIFTFSMHGSKNYPAKKQASDYDLDLPDGTGDKDYLYNLEFALDSILKRFTPDHILYQGGVDVLQSDQLGRLGLTMMGCKKRDEIVFNTIRSLNTHSTLTLGGGYSRDINVIIQAHVNTISTALDILG